ncbi:MAG: hypothetical protein JNL11_00490 [Bdellovibrionaceae bacterium]|nr:hypothetical protein [Pseudobdellovibrionaceae bacterium]
MGKINKAYLPFIVVGAVAVIMFFYDPPYSICHNQLQSYRLSMVGKLYGRREGKNVLPAKIGSAVVSCKTGKTVGSCIDYFEIINEALTRINQLDGECFAGLVDEKPLFENSKNFFLIMNAIAWGNKVPSDNRDNWLSQANLFVYCKNKNFLKSVLTAEEFDGLVSQSIRSFPYEKLPFDFDENSEEFLNNKAVNKMAIEDVVAKSILSIRCEGM